MIYIKERPYDSANEDGIYPDDTDGLNIVASGLTSLKTLKNLVLAINEDEVDELNNELIIVIE